MLHRPVDGGEKTFTTRYAEGSMLELAGNLLELQKGAGTEVCRLFYLLHNLLASFGVELDGVVDPVYEPVQ